jgi:hypothetical protein
MLGVDSDFFLLPLLRCAVCGNVIVDRCSVADNCLMQHDTVYWLRFYTSGKEAT